MSLSELLALSSYGLSFPICQVDMNSYTSLNQRGTNELTWATQPSKEDYMCRTDTLAHVPPQSGVWRAQGAESGPWPTTEDREMAAGPWGGVLSYHC